MRDRARSEGEPGSVTVAAFLSELYTTDDVEEPWRAHEPSKAEASAKRHRRIKITNAHGEVDEMCLCAHAQMDRFFRREAIDRLEQIAEVERSQVHGGRGSVAIVAPRWQRHRDRTALARLLDLKTGTLDKRQARTEALLTLVAQADIETEAELQPTDHVTPLDERGPPSVRAIASDIGHGYAPSRKDLTGCRKTTIVPTGHMCGGER